MRRGGSSACVLVGCVVLVCASTVDGVRRRRRRPSLAAEGRGIVGRVPRDPDLAGRPVRSAVTHRPQLRRARLAARPPGLPRRATPTSCSRACRSPPTELDQGQRWRRRADRRRRCRSARWRSSCSGPVPDGFTTLKLLLRPRRSRTSPTRRSASSSTRTPAPVRVPNVNLAAMAPEVRRGGDAAAVELEQPGRPERDGRRRTSRRRRSPGRRRCCARTRTS